MTPFAAAFLTSLSIAMAWMSVIGPFRGMDEFDHAYRADSVANGNWEAKPDGAVVVDRSFAGAIEPVCLSRRDLDQACEPRRSVGDRLEVISTAGAYNPVFYWVVGASSSAFEAYDRLYVMRLLLAVLNSLLFGTAVLIALRCFATFWPAWAVLLTITPQAGAANMVVAANGLESSAALVVWLCLLAAAHGGLSAPWVRSLPLIALIVGVPIGFMRTLGPLWLVCIIGAVAMTVGLGARSADGLRSILHQRFRSRLWLACGAAWIISSLAGVAWAVVSGTNSLPSEDGNQGGTDSSPSTGATSTGDGITTLLRPVVWLFQIVGALPYRDEPLPISLYAVAVTSGFVVAVLAARCAPRAFRRAAAAAALVSLAVPLAFGLVTGQGSLWQGRYCWPLVMGTFVILGVGMDVARVQVSRQRRVTIVASLVMIPASVMSWALLHVAESERRKNPLAGSDAWLTMPDLLIGVLPVIALTVAHSAVLRSDGRQVPASRPRTGATASGPN